MTYEQFLKKLEETESKWFLYGKMLRTKDYPQRCPITEVASNNGKQFEVYDPLKAGAQLQLSTETVQRIIDATDHFMTSFPTIRKDLLKATRVKEWEESCEN